MAEKKEKKEKVKEEKKKAKEEKVEEKKEEKAKSEEKKEEAKEEKKDKKKKEEKVDIVSEDVYTVPLRGAYRTKPHYRRARKAVTILTKYLERHTKSDNVKISNILNRHIWSRGASKPPRKVQIKAVKDSEGKVVANLLK